MKRLKRFILNTIILVITSIFIHSASMVFNVYIANKIGSEAIGLFGLIMSVYFFAMTIANSGIGLASTRIVAEELAKDCEAGTKIAIRKCIGYSLCFGILASVLLFTFAPIVCNTLLHKRITPIALHIIAISLPFSSVSTSINGYFIAVKRVSKNSLYEIFNLLLKITLTIILFGLIPLRNIESACIILIIANTFSEIISFIYLYFLYIIDKRKIQNTRTSDESCLKRVLKISIPVAITSYIRSGLSTIKQLLIPLRLEKHGMSCDTAISSYGLINGMVMPLLLFPGLIINSVSSLLIPEFARYNIKKDFKRMNEVLNTILCLSTIFSVFVVIIYIIFHKKIAIITYNNMEIAHYLLLLAPLSCFMYLDHIVDAVLKGIDKQVGVMYCNIVDLVFSILLINTFVPIYGINGYILVLYISEIFNFSISIYQLYKATHFN